MTTAHAARLPMLEIADAVKPVAGTGQLIVAAVLGIALIIVLITWLKLHPFLALTIGSLVVGGIAGENMLDVIDSFVSGVGDTAGGVGVLVALGAMFGKVLADSGGASQIVDTIVGRSNTRTLPWAMALIGAIIGLPMFFEIGLVLLMPVIFLVAKRSGEPLLRVGIPTLAGLSAMHGFVPPHPGPLTAIQYLDANLGLTLGLGVLVAIPTVVIAGPLFASVATRWVDVPTPSTFGGEEDEDDGSVTALRPTFVVTLATVLLPVVLMLAKAFADVLDDGGDGVVHQGLDFVGEPLVALLIAVIVSLFTLGRSAGMGRQELSSTLEKALPPIAGILLIVSAGGGFKQTLVDTGIGQVLADAIKDSGFSVLVLAWLVAVFIRLATGSATVATVTASGIMAPLADGLATGEVSLLVLAVGAGSLFFSHVNDAGFWLVKEYFGMSIGQTIKSWSVMETIISVSGLVFVLLLSIVV